MKIFIDAGHNHKGFDTGAESFGLKEQDLTFEISKLLAEKLLKAGITVKLSREKKEDVLGTDLNSSLLKRCQMANDFGADLFLSIHTNAYRNEDANGTECYVYNKISDTFNLAEKISNSLSQKLGLLNRGVKEGKFAVLKNTNMPAILIETAFITNKSDSEKFKTKQEEFAKAISDSIISYFEIREEKISSPLLLVNKLTEKIKINDILGAVNALSAAKKQESPLYWIIYKIVNREDA